MFIARIVLTIRDQEREAFRRLAAAEARNARALAGCVDYRFCEDVADPSSALLYEEWASRDAFEAYKASPVFAAAGAWIAPLLAEPPRSAYYESNDLFTPCAVAGE